MRTSSHQAVADETSENRAIAAQRFVHHGFVSSKAVMAAFQFTSTD
jgi:hypothetical protein